MDDRTYYVLCRDNCKFEGMTKEQILTAIEQAVNEGKISNIDAGFVTTVKTINGTPLRFFVGTQSEYELLTDADKDGCFALITNDNTAEAINEAIAGLTQELADLAEGLTKKIDDNKNGLINDLVEGDLVPHYSQEASVATKATTTSFTNNSLQDNGGGLLLGEGYFFFCLDTDELIGNSITPTCLRYNFGVVYVDNTYTTYTPVVGSYYLTIDNNFGVRVWKDGVNVTSTLGAKVRWAEIK